MKNKLILSILSLSIMLLTVQHIWAQLSITTSGRVGVGTDSPSSDTKLHVVRNDYVSYLNNYVLKAEFTGTNVEYADPIGVYGKSIPQANCGYGGYFEGGCNALYAKSTISGTGKRYGISAYGQNGSSKNYGIYAYGKGSGSSTNYGIFAYGSGGSYNYAGYFSGNVTVTGTFSNPSDSKLKENIEPIGVILPELMKLEPKTFNYKRSPEFEYMNLPSGKQYGFVAQEFEKTLPELVSTAVHPSAGEFKDEKKDEEPIAYKTINYIEMIPLLLQALKEQQKMIEELQNEMQK